MTNCLHSLQRMEPRGHWVGPSEASTTPNPAEDSTQEGPTDQSLVA